MLQGTTTSTLVRRLLQAQAWVPATTVRAAHHDCTLEELVTQDLPSQHNLVCAQADIASGLQAPTPLASVDLAPTAAQVLACICG